MLSKDDKATIGRLVAAQAAQKTMSDLTFKYRSTPKAVRRARVSDLEGARLTTSREGLQIEDFEGNAYSAPELLKDGPKKIGFAVDSWSIGVILYEMATGKKLFDDTELVDSQKVKFSDPYFETESGLRCKDLITKLLASNP